MKTEVFGYKPPFVLSRCFLSYAGSANVVNITSELRTQTYAILFNLNDVKCGFDSPKISVERKPTKGRQIDPVSPRRREQFPRHRLVQYFKHSNSITCIPFFGMVTLDQASRVRNTDTSGIDQELFLL